MKHCNKCGEHKPISEFYTRTEDKNKYMACCKLCANARTRKNFSTEKSTMEGHARQIFMKRRRVARVKSIPFEIDWEYALSLLTPNCAILGTPLNWCEKTEKPKPDSPSLDKIIPELGYIKGNVAWVSHKANTIKSYGSLEEHQKIVDYIKSAHPKNK